VTEVELQLQGEKSQSVKLYPEKAAAFKVSSRLVKLRQHYSLHTFLSDEGWEFKSRALLKLSFPT